MKRQITHITAGFPKTHAMRLLEHSSIANGLRFHALPAHYDQRRINTIDKILLLRAFLATGAVGADDLVLFTDAYDVLVLDHAAVIHDRFLSLNVDILVNAEANFYPDHRADLRALFDQVPTKWRYLNSGCYIGFAWAIQIMLEAIGRAIPGSGVDAHHLDQMLMQEFYAAGARDHAIRMALDLESLIFAPLMMSEDDFVLDRRGVRNRVTGRHTCILHANGDRRNMKALEAIATLTEHEPRYLAVLAIHGTTLSYDAAQQKLFADGNTENPVLVLVDGRRAFSFTHDCPILTYYPDGTVHADAPAINIWETLIVTQEAPQTFHGTFLEGFVADVLPGAVELAPMPIALLRADSMRRALERFTEIAVSV